MKHIVRTMVLFSFVCMNVQASVISHSKHPAVRAFLDTIACIEGTYDAGYNVQFGGGKFTGYDDHPRVNICCLVKGERIYSTAAGRYQLESYEWDEACHTLSLSRFTPINQDYAMVYILQQSGALAYVKNLQFMHALDTLRASKTSVDALLSGKVMHCSVSGLYATFIARLRYYNGGDVSHSDVLDVYLSYPEVRAFLDVIAFAEGTYTANGYYKRFAGAYCDNLRRHPEVPVCAKSQGRRLCSTAAGRYQMLKGTWNIIAWRIAAKDFSAYEQDRAAVQILLDRGIMQPLMHHDIITAIKRANKGWASLPGSPHNQPTYTWKDIRDMFEKRLAYYQKNFKNKT